MKKVIALFCGLFVATVTHSFGQDNRLDIGFEGGPSYCSLRGNSHAKEYNNLRFTSLGGIFVQANLTDHISLRTAINFDRKGGFDYSDLTDINGAVVDKGYSYANYDYLTLPILFRVSTDRNIRFFANAGPYIGYLLKSSFTLKENGYKTLYSFDNTSNCKRFDIGVSTGFGLCTPVGRKLGLSFELRNDLGLLNTSSVPVIDDGSIKLNSTKLIIGLNYKID